MSNRKLVNEFGTYTSYEGAADETKDPEMTRLVRILRDHGDIPRLLASLRKNMALDAEDADVVVSTVHRSKGLEWETVVLENDFPDLFDTDNPKMTTEMRADELNLLYVAATRAQHSLVINATIEELILKMHAQARRARGKYA